MTTALDTLFASIVPTVLSTYGASIVITKRTGTASPSTRDLTSVSTTAQTLDCSPPAVVRSLAPGESILQVGDFETIVKGTPTFAPEVTHVATFGGRDYQIVKSTPMYSGDAVAAYTLFLRAAQ